jgi:penicillin-binding protein 1A
LAQLAFLTHDRTVTVKVQELLVTLRLERDYSKDEILEFYLNRLFLGGSTYGVQAAAQYYFNKDVQDLNLAECALIAGLIPAPNGYSPYVNLEKAKTRQSMVLDNMERFGHITAEQKQQALDYKLVLGTRKNATAEQNAQYFIDYVRNEAVDILQSQGYSRAEATNMLYTGGLTINTTLDVRMQSAAQKAMDEGIEQWLVPLLSNKDERNATGMLEPESAIILLDSKTGGIRAMIGGREYQSDQYNRAVQLIKQQPGSSIKPLTVYGPALERGMTAASIINDEPLYENGADKAPYPVNYDGKYRGPVTLRYAWQESLNVPAWRIAKENGVDRMLEFAQRLGITTLVEKPINGASDRNLAALAIGGVTKGVIPLEMARAYSAIANKGVLNDCMAIVDIRDARGQVLYQTRPHSEVVLSEEVAYMMTDIMQDVVNYGTAHFVRSLGGYYGPVAGKTGTTNYNREAWFVGFTPELSAAVYIGHDDNTTGLLAGDRSNPTSRGRLPGGSSSYISAGIFGRMMKYISAQVPGADQFYNTRPGNIIGPLAIDKTTSLLAGPICPGENIIYEQFIKGTEPTEICNAHSFPEQPSTDPNFPPDENTGNNQSDQTQNPNDQNPPNQGEEQTDPNQGGGH